MTPKQERFVAEDGLKQALYQREQAFLHGLEALYPDDPIRCDMCQGIIVLDGWMTRDMTPRLLAEALEKGVHVKFRPMETAIIDPALAARVLR